MRTRAHAAALLLAALAILAWCCAAYCHQWVSERSGGVLVRFQEDGVSPDQLARMSRWAAEDGGSGGPVASLWKETPNVTLGDDYGDRSWNGPVLTLFGSGEDVWPASFLWGGYPVKGDTEGIALDESAAHALWGSAAVPGASVRLDGRTRYLRGVFRGTEGLALVQGAQSGAEPYGNLLLRFPEGGDREQAEAWLTAGGLPTGTVVDLPLLSWILGAVTALPCVLLGLGVLLRLYRRGAELRNAPIQLAAYLLPALAACAAVLWSMGPAADVPVRLIPTRWSDFAFWGKLGAGMLDEAQGWLALLPGRRELDWWLPAVGSTVASAAGAGLTLLAAERVRPRTGWGALLSSAAALGLTWLGAALFAKWGGVAVSRAMWLLPLLWVWTGLGLDRHAQFLLTPKENGHETHQIKSL